MGAIRMVPLIGCLIVLCWPDRPLLCSRGRCLWCMTSAPANGWPQQVGGQTPAAFCHMLSLEWYCMAHCLRCCTGFPLLAPPLRRPHLHMPLAYIPAKNVTQGLGHVQSLLKAYRSALTTHASSASDATIPCLNISAQNATCACRCLVFLLMGCAPGPCWLDQGSGGSHCLRCSEGRCWRTAPCAGSAGIGTAVRLPVKGICLPATINQLLTGAAPQQ